MKTESDDNCRICGHVNSNDLETHHVVPRRYGGSNSPSNLVTLCGSCHNALENIYDDRFYARLNIQQPREPITEEDIGDDHLNRIWQTNGFRPKVIDSEAEFNPTVLNERLERTGVQ